MILHVSQTADGTNGVVSVTFKILRALPTPASGAPAPKPNPNDPYPGFAVIGAFTVPVAAVDAPNYPRGKEITI